MRKLLTYLLILTAVSLARPLNAQKMTVQLWADKSTPKYLELESNNPWKKTISGSDFDTWGVVNDGKVYMLPVVDNDGTNTYYYSSSNFTWLDNGKSYKFWKYNDPGKDCGIVLPKNYTAYNFTFEVSNFNSNEKSIDFKVSWEKPRYDLQLKSSLNNWGTGAPNESSAGYTWTWDKSKLSSISSGSKISFKLYDADEDKWYGVSGDTETQATSSWQSCVEDGSNWYVTYTKGNTYTIDAQRVNGTWQVKVTTNEEPHDYYWVSPQITNGEMWPAFKMVASRNRNMTGGGDGAADGKISTKYYTFTIKNEDLVDWKTKTKIADRTKIQWYIVRDDGGLAFRPENDDPSTTQESTSLTCGGVTDDAVDYRNFMGYKDEGATRTGYFEFNKGYNNTSNSKKALAYTFIINNEKGNVFFNYAHKAADTSKEYDLVGNFSNAKGNVAIDLNNANFRKDMTKYWYKDGEGSTTMVAGADSIVYKVEVKKPTEGWGDLYIDVIPDNSKDWTQALRPLISLGNNLDGRALHGALTTAKSEQSLNPETSNDYTSYTFSFNATTRTYRLEFHTSLYLVGPGVSATGGTGSWNISNPSTSDPRIRLTPTQEKDHYRNLVYFTQGQPFRFIKNTDESSTTNYYEYSWVENSYKPKWITATNDADYYPDSETQFRNYMKYENGTGTAPTEGDESMTFDLPTGWYYVNFYPNAGKPYYTIEHSMELRDFNEVYYRAAGTAEQRNVKGRNDYNFLRVWSDHIAWNKPDNIDVFVVSAFNHDATSHTTTATLTKLNVNYIPAKTGVILGCKLSKDNLTSGLVYNDAATSAWEKGENVNYYNTLTAELTPYSAASTSYSGESKLIPLYNETSLQRFSDKTGIGTGEGYANYLFGFYRCKKYQKNYTGDPNDFQMGFWLTTGKGTTYANSAFLHLTKAQAEDLGVGTAYDNIESASAPAFMLLFDESDDNVITGISDITTAKGNSVASQGWYTLQGVRTAKPTQRGIYIYNGKKVIVND